MGLTGYYQRPTICGDKLVFIYEDDLWIKDLKSSSTLASRLTSNPGRANDPQLSPDGCYLAYTSLDEGHPEIYVTHLDEMEPRRLTYLGEDTRCVGWSRDGQHVLFTTNAGNPFGRIFQLAQVSKDGGPWTPLNLGPASHISYASEIGRVLGRHTWDPARWKRYRGGTAGQLWIDIAENGQFKPLLKIKGNLTRPIWMKDRIYFGSDHEDICNLYSCLSDGSDLKSHSYHNDFFIRYPNSDGQRLVYQCGGDIFLVDPNKLLPEKLEITVQTQRQRLARHFVSAAHYLEDYSLSPDGAKTAIVTRGKAFCFAHWEGAVTQLGERDGVRYRLLRWGPCGVFCVNDQHGEEEIGIFFTDKKDTTPHRYVTLTGKKDIGRVLQMGIAPCGKRLWFTNHRHELFCIELSQTFIQNHKGSKSKKKSKKSDQGKAPNLHKITEDKFQRIKEASFSPDSQWLAFSRCTNRQDSQICLWNWKERKVIPVTTTPFFDWSPNFDPEGRYLYFLSCRDFDPVKDNLFFDYSFPKAARPYLITLQKEQPDPFLHQARPPGADPTELPSPYLEDKSESKKKKKKGENHPQKIKVDLEGIQDRLRVFPVTEGRYFGVIGIKGKVILGRSPASSVLKLTEPPARNPESCLETFDFNSGEVSVSFRGISGFDVSLDHSTVIYRNDKSLRVIKAEKNDCRIRQELQPGIRLVGSQPGQSFHQANTRMATNVRRGMASYARPFLGCRYGLRQLEKCSRSLSSIARTLVHSPGIFRCIMGVPGRTWHLPRLRIWWRLSLWTLLRSGKTCCHPKMGWALQGL